MVMNAGVIQSGRIDISGGGTTITFYATPAAGAFTASSAKFAWVNICYEA